MSANQAIGVEPGITTKRRVRTAKWPAADAAPETVRNGYPPRPITGVPFTTLGDHTIPLTVTYTPTRDQVTLSFPVSAVRYKVQVNVTGEGAWLNLISWLEPGSTSVQIPNLYPHPPWIRVVSELGTTSEPVLLLTKLPV